MIHHRNIEKHHLIGTGVNFFTSSTGVLHKAGVASRNWDCNIDVLPTPFIITVFSDVVTAVFMRAATERTSGRSLLCASSIICCTYRHIRILVELGAYFVYRRVSTVVCIYAVRRRTDTPAVVMRVPAVGRDKRCSSSS